MKKSNDVFMTIMTFLKNVIFLPLIYSISGDDDFQKRHYRHKNVINYKMFYNLLLTAFNICKKNINKL
jgi:large-conductance mechanosensitive channel